jgi:hypothetical protein
LNHSTVEHSSKPFSILEADMEKSMSEITVKTDKELVMIIQPNMQSEDYKDMIFLNKCQVDLLIKWLIEARDEPL